MGGFLQDQAMAASDAAGSSNRVLSSAGADGFIRVWPLQGTVSEDENISPVLQLSPHHGSVAAVRWNHNSECIELVKASELSWQWC